MNREDDETLEDVNSLMNLIGGKKKGAPPRPPVAEKVTPEDGAPASEAGDFSTLIKKLGMANKPEPAPAAAGPAAERVRPSITPSDSTESFFSDSDDKTGPVPESAPAPGEPARRAPDPGSRNVRGTLGKLLARGAAPSAEEEPAPVPQKPAPPLQKPVPPPAQAAARPVPEEEVVEIIDEDPKAALRKRKPAKKVVTETTEEAQREPPRRAPDAPVLQKSAPPPAQAAARPVPEEEVVEIIDEDPKAALRKRKPAKKVVTETTEEAPEVADGDEKIISVDQIADLSGLILPKGATFKVDEINLHGRINAFEGTGTSALPAEFVEIWKKEFSTVGFKDLDIDEEIIAEKAKVKPAGKKFGFASIFKAISAEQEEYDPKVHGPLVDLSFVPKPGIEEMELYPVNEPYAYIRITYDHSTHEYMYHVLEPLLSDPEKDLLKELKERLFETLDINTKDISKEEARQKLRVAANEIMLDFGLNLSPLEREKIHYNMFKDFLGDGLIDPIMHDKYIEDISCDGVHTPLFAFHASYESMKTSVTYNTAEELDSFVTKLAQRAGKYISIAEPILDATMQDGSRIQMTLGQEVTAHGSTFTIRKFKDEPITPTDLIEWHTFSPLAIAYIWLCVEAGKSAIFAGGTASGKTTALNAISLFIPPMAKIVSLEDTREVKLPHPNWIPSVTRDSFDTAGRGEINMYELLRAAMRQRPEYIIVGEVRGKECQTLFQAMSTGHVTYSTTHADSVASVVHRIENPPMDVPRNMLSALDFVLIQVQARVGGKRIRRNKQIVEILDIDPRTNELITNEVFKWRSATDEHSYSGKSYLLEEIMEAKGWSDNRMREELKRRQEVLEWMRIKKIRHYKDVAKILISYFRDPESVIEKVRKDLYE
ncbi:MAG: Flp pilus assembly complex ATPase component TadA [Methanoregula sp.]|nr:Flp pilus assembly complex ATPase component TadA [Methanoregula sp.]